MAPGPWRTKRSLQLIAAPPSPVEIRADLNHVRVSNIILPGCGGERRGSGGSCDVLFLIGPGTRRCRCMVSWLLRVQIGPNANINEPDIVKHQL
ncbi:hypothetical protein BC938DRAFT_484125 [Jimgerdemannia flammicorona]|uniref:Uncharacterized protein n=1 Tax=Jimgerdemannia flammicorona TaxID=994334 RepID=A0A433QAD7_9FUNG|nr:hypothetical protein BC938DRAFT_484125 [Jimgerdemannia flammicorona]